MQNLLSAAEVRVLGCLIEKETATPEYYPLTLNALVAACNQKSNRDPVVQFDEATVVRALNELRWTHHLVTEITSTISRVPKYGHCVTDKWKVTPAEQALLCELFLRGPQTPGELRTHASRLHAFSDPREVETALEQLGAEGKEGFVAKLPREPGRREQRWAHLLAGELVVEPEALRPPPEPARIQVAAEDARIAALEIEAAALRQELEALKSTFAEFRKQFD